MSNANLPPSGGSVLVTGASGFLGRHLLAALSERGRVGHGLVRDVAAFVGQDWVDELGGVSTVEGGLSDRSVWISSPALSDCQSIIHSAALVDHSRSEADKVYRTNVDGTLEMVRAAHDLGARLVFVSTSGTVGCFDDPDARADELAPYVEDVVKDWPYYHSKIIAEREAIALADDLGVELVIIRPPVMLGPGDHRFRSTSNLIRFMKGKLPFVIRGGFDFVDIRDAAAAMCVAASMPSPRPVYHLPGTSCGVQEFFQMAAPFAGRPAPRFVVPFRPAWVLATGLHKVGLHVLPDPVVVEMASKYWGVSTLYSPIDLDFSPRAGDETLGDTIAWLKAHCPDLT